MSHGLSLPLNEAIEAVRLGSKRSNGETIGAALVLIQSGTQMPQRTLRLQELLASATVCSSEGLLLQSAFGRAIARRFAANWKTFAANPFLFTSPRKTVPPLEHVVTAIEQGKASVRILIEKAAQALGVAVGEVTSRLE